MDYEKMEVIRWWTKTDDFRVEFSYNGHVKITTDTSNVYADFLNLTEFNLWVMKVMGKYLEGLKENEEI